MIHVADEEGGFGEQEQVKTEAEKADEETILRLCESYGVTEEAAIKALKNNKYDEDKAGEALEKGMDLEADDFGI